jgi:hypothetical protein
VIAKLIKEIIIYEDIDGKKTIYARNGGSETVLLKNNQSDFIKVVKLDRWISILELAEAEISLNDLISKAETMYELIRTRKDHN